MKILILLFFILTAAPARSYLVSTGTYVPYLNKAQTSNSGATQKFEINPYLSLGTQIFMSGQQYFLPEIGYAYFMENASGSRTEMIFLHYNFGYVLSSEFLLRYGLTTHQYRIIGKGGTTSLSNGNNPSREFHNPDKTVTSYFTTINIGTEYFFLNKTRGLRFDLNMMSIAEFENRIFNYLLTFNLYF